MQPLYIVGSIHCFFLATLFYSRKNSNYPQRILSAIFIILGLLLFDHYLELTGTLYKYPQLLGVTYSLPFILGPLFLLYTLVSTRGDVPILKFVLIHVWPFIITNTYLVSDYYLLSPADKITFFHQQSENPSAIILMIEIMLVLAVPFYSIWSIILVQKHKIHIKNDFSNLRNINYQWWEIVLLSFVLLSLISILLNLMSDGFYLIDYLLADNITMAGITISVFFIGYYGIKQKAIYQQKPVNIDQKFIESEKPIDSSSLEEINNALKNDKIYLNGTLTLRDMAQHLGTTENKLSYLINKGLSKNFYDLINEHRVEHVKRLLMDSKYDHLSILGIAFESGFNSKSSFQNVFRKWTGVTPSDFKKNFQNKSKPT